MSKRGDLEIGTSFKTLPEPWQNVPRRREVPAWAVGIGLTIALLGTLAASLYVHGQMLAHR